MVTPLDKKPDKHKKKRLKSEDHALHVYNWQIIVLGTAYARFKYVPIDIENSLKNITSVEVLESLFDEALFCQTLYEFTAAVELAM
jgi:hypothetical protein